MCIYIYIYGRSHKFYLVQLPCTQPLYKTDCRTRFCTRSRDLVHVQGLWNESGRGRVWGLAKYPPRRLTHFEHCSLIKRHKFID